MTDYQKYQLQWMMDHEISLEELIQEIEAARQEFHPETPLNEIFPEWENNTGFSGQIWACENEWEDCEAKPETETRVILPFGKGENQLMLVAENIANPEFGPEIAVGIADHDATNWLQDIAIVRIRDDKAQSEKPAAEVLIYEDEYDENYTHKLKINLYPQDATEVMLPKNFFSGKPALTPEEALERSLAEMGHADMEYMVAITGMGADKIENALKERIFPIPEVQEDVYPRYITSDEYLSGTPETLMQRLNDALCAAEMSDAFDSNVVALQKALCGMSLVVDMALRLQIQNFGGKMDQYDIPHFDEEVFEKLQYAGESVHHPGKRTLMVHSDNGPILLTEGINFVIDKRKE